MRNPFNHMGRVISLMFNRAGLIAKEQVEEASKILKSGGVVALPTDTIYGLAARIEDDESLDRIYKIKGRDGAKPLSVCVNRIDEIDQIADTSGLRENVLSSLLPGPVTVLLNRKKTLNARLNPGIETVGIRIPDHSFIRAVCENVGPLALTSANRSGESSPIDVSEFIDLWPELDAIFDNGVLSARPRATIRAGSTVVDLSKPRMYSILREGCSSNRTISILNRLGYRRVS